MNDRLHPKQSPAHAHAAENALTGTPQMRSMAPPPFQLVAENSEEDQELEAMQMKSKDVAPFQLAADDEEDTDDEIQMKSQPAAPFQLMDAEEDDNLQMKSATPVQRQGEGQGDTTGQAPEKTKANNTGLPDDLKAGIENLSGYSMDDVKVHYNSDKPAQLQAHAYAQGTDIHIGAGQEKHLPHEAWHVVQQKQGRVKPTVQMKGEVNVNDDSELENEADIMGERVTNLVPDHKNEINFDQSLSTPPTIQKVLQRKPIVQNLLDLKTVSFDVGKAVDETIKALKYEKIFTDMKAHPTFELTINSVWDPHESSYGHTGCNNVDNEAKVTINLCSNRDKATFQSTLLHEITTHVFSTFQRKNNQHQKGMHWRSGEVDHRMLYDKPMENSWGRGVIAMTHSFPNDELAVGEKFVKECIKDMRNHLKMAKNQEALYVDEKNSEINDFEKQLMGIIINKRKQNDFNFINSPKPADLFNQRSNTQRSNHYNQRNITPPPIKTNRTFQNNANMLLNNSQYTSDRERVFGNYVMTFDEWLNAHKKYRKLDKQLQFDWYMRYKRRTLNRI